MTKKAMVDVYKTERVPLIQIHDEIAISVKDDEEANEVSKIMENAIELVVPNKCDIEIGSSWGDSAE
jgi:DNA polymerase I-like protein with 3'-5' exonuclease and polymerase domains